MHLCICKGAFLVFATLPSNSCRKLVWKSKVCGVFSFVFLSSCWQSARMTGPTGPLGKQRLSRYETASESEAGRLAKVCCDPGCSLELYSCCSFRRPIVSCPFCLWALGVRPHQPLPGWDVPFRDNAPQWHEQGVWLFWPCRSPSAKTRLPFEAAHDSNGCGADKPAGRNTKPPARTSYKPCSLQGTSDLQRTESDFESYVFRVFHCHCLFDW